MHTDPFDTFCVFAELNGLSVSAAFVYRAMPFDSRVTNIAEHVHVGSTQLVLVSWLPSALLLLSC